MNIIHLGEIILSISFDLYQMKYKKSIKFLFGILTCLTLLNSAGAQSDSEILKSTFTAEFVVGAEGKIIVNHLKSEITKLPSGLSIKVINPKTIGLKEGCTVKGLFKFREFASAGGLGTTRVKAHGKGVLQSMSVMDHHGQPVGCPTFCRKSLFIELQISSGDLGSGR